MPLSREQHDMLQEIVQQSRRMYRSALKMQKEEYLDNVALAELVINSKLSATWVDLLWRKTGDEPREQVRERMEARTEEIRRAQEVDPTEE